MKRNKKVLGALALTGLLVAKQGLKFNAQVTEQKNVSVEKVIQNSADELNENKEMKKIFINLPENKKLKFEFKNGAYENAAFEKAVVKNVEKFELNKDLIEITPKFGFKSKITLESNTDESLTYKLEITRDYKNAPQHINLHNKNKVNVFKFDEELGEYKYDQSQSASKFKGIKDVEFKGINFEVKPLENFKININPVNGPKNATNDSDFELDITEIKPEQSSKPATQKPQTQNHESKPQNHESKPQNHDSKPTHVTSHSLHQDITDTKVNVESKIEETKSEIKNEINQIKELANEEINEKISNTKQNVSLDLGNAKKFVIEDKEKIINDIKGHVDIEKIISDIKKDAKNTKENVIEKLKDSVEGHKFLDILNKNNVNLGEIQTSQEFHDFVMSLYGQDSTSPIQAVRGSKSDTGNVVLILSLTSLAALVASTKSIKNSKV